MTTSVDEITETRTGRFVPQPEGYRTFIPWGLPPDPPIESDPELWYLLSQADGAIGRLDGSASTLIHPELFTPIFVRNEAVLSSQIEGIEVTLLEFLKFEADTHDSPGSQKMEHIRGCHKAMDYGHQKILKSPFSFETLLGCHEQLHSTGLRGKGHKPGQLRVNQNYVGAPGSTVQTARFVPPPPDHIQPLIDNLEEFILRQDHSPILISAGMAHAHFETIHPFEDGNGPLGRILVALLLTDKGVLSHPFLPLSCYFRHHRKEYYDRLQAIRDHGEWENWLKFFLRAVFHVSKQATDTVIQIVQLRDNHWHQIAKKLGGQAGQALQLLDKLFQNPIISVQGVEKIIKDSMDSAQKIIVEFQKLGLLKEVSGRVRNQQFAYLPYLELFDSAPPCPTDAEAPQEEKASEPATSAVLS
ncbi:Fic family protein [Candidatus Neomarinimicrobiota bacterium]